MLLSVVDEIESQRSFDQISGRHVSVREHDVLIDFQIGCVREHALGVGDGRDEAALMQVPEHNGGRDVEDEPGDAHEPIASGSEYQMTC